MTNYFRLATWLFVAFGTRLPAQDLGVVAPDNGAVSMLSHTNIEVNGIVRDDILDVWGYFDPNTGREYAIVGFGLRRSPRGVSIIDVTDPALPRSVANVTSVYGFDMKVWQHYLYTVSGGAFGEGGIVDISDPASPELVGSFPSSHNIFIAENGFLYSETPGLRIYDLNPDPTSPILVFDDGSRSGHDASVIGNRLFDFHGGDGTNIYDVTDPANPQLQGRIRDPAIRYHHSGWTTKDGRYLYICDELARHPSADITIWDISDVKNPQRVAEYADPDAAVHNLYIVGDFAYISYYKSGFLVLDVTQPEAPTPAGRFDTSDFRGEGFDGAFGAFAFAPSGNIYVSDIQEGLFVFSFAGQPTDVSLQDPGPSRFELVGNYPNPFNPETTISYQIPSTAQVSLFVYNTLGQKIRTLVSETLAAGAYRVAWDGRDDSGRAATSGIYFYQIQSEGFRDTKRMVLVR